MAYNAGKNLTIIIIVSPEVWGKKFLQKPNHPYHPPSPPPPPASQNKNSNGMGIQFRLHVAQKKDKRKQATNQNLRYVIYNIYIKFYILP